MGAKTLFHREKPWELLGVHIFGEDAADLLHSGQARIPAEGKSLFVNTVFNIRRFGNA